MNIDEIRELIALANESGVAELEIQRGENRVRIRRGGSSSPQEFVVSPAAAPAAAPQSTPLQHRLQSQPNPGNPPVPIRT